MAPTVYTAEEAAPILRCTASWLKEQARKREIPFFMAGSGYRWTDAHLDEIIRLREQRPAPRTSTRAPARRPAAPDAGTPPVVLNFRTPRRRKPAA
jgi:hypothetical protein